MAFTGFNVVKPNTTAHTSSIKVLWWLHCIAFILHFALVLSAIISITDVGTVHVPVFWPIAQWNYTACAIKGYDAGVLVCPSDTMPEKVGDVNLGAVLIISQTITCTFHAIQLIQTQQHDSIYITWSVIKGIKVWHWLEYILTAPLVAHVILYLSGMLDLPTQIIVYGSQSTLMLIGMLQDILRDYVVTNPISATSLRVVKFIIISSFVVGFYNVFSIWFPAFYLLFINSLRSETDPPAFVKWIVLIEFMLYTSFGIAQFVFFLPMVVSSNSRSLTYFSFIFEEITFTVLSFASKAVLATAFSMCLVYNKCM